MKNYKTDIEIFFNELNKPSEPNEELKNATMKYKDKIINKMNEGQEPDTVLYNWENISDGLKNFWFNYFEKQ